MSISIGTKLVGSDVSFYNHPLAQVSVGPVVVWQHGGGALIAKVKLVAGALTVMLLVEQYNGESLEVTWGDGGKSTEANIATNSEGLKGIEHVYSGAGTYTIELRGGCKVYYKSRYPLIYLGKGNSELVGLEVHGVCPIRQWCERALYYQYGPSGSATMAIPKGLFNGIGKLESSVNARLMFANVGVRPRWGGSVPEDLFAGLPSNVSSVDCEKMFQYCAFKGSVPSNIFGSLGRVISLNCSDLFFSSGVSGSVPATLFESMPLLTNLNCSYMFHGSDISGGVPVGLFSKQAYLTSLHCSYMFSSSGVSGSVPATLFTGLKVLKNLGCAAMFSNCNGLSGSVPTGLFKGVLSSSGVSLNCALMFEQCDWVKAAPSSAFLDGLNQAGGCSVLDVHGIFYSCKNLTGSAAGGWFSAGKGYSFRRILSNMYSGTNVTGIASNFLEGVPNDGSSVGGSGYMTELCGMFNGCTGLKGTVPSYWTTFSALPDNAVKGFYAGCTNASNYGSIPAVWKQTL